MGIQDDLDLVESRKPAIKKLMLLPTVVETLQKVCEVSR